MREIEKTNVKTIRRHTIPPRAGSRCPCFSQMRSGFQQAKKNSSKNIQQGRIVLIGPEKHREIGIDFGQSRPPQHHKTLLNNIDHQNSTFTPNSDQFSNGVRRRQLPRAVHPKQTFGPAAGGVGQEDIQGAGGGCQLSASEADCA